MISIFLTVFLGLSQSAGADTFILKDGGVIEGELTGELDGAALIKTKYGPLTVNKEDIREQKTETAPEPVPAAEPVELSSAQPAAVTTSSAPTAVEVSTTQPKAAAQPKLTFQTVLPSSITRQLVYLESGIAVATETYDNEGALISAEGLISDGTYTEYYPEGGLKTVKTMLGGKANGTLKAFYPGGALQIEAYYLAGGKEGPLKYFTPDGKPLMEASYRNDMLNGWKKEYGEDGTITAQSYYIDDHLAEPPKQQAVPEPEKEPESMVTVKSISLARGERFTFRLNGKYIGKAHLDKDLNIISRGGKIPDGNVKMFTKDGRIEKEFVFKNNAIKALRVYEPGGPLKAEYSYKDDMAIKK